MSNLFLGWPNRIDEAALSGGAWLSGLPLANLKERALSKVCRSVNASTGSTVIDLDLGQARSLRALALQNHNLSQAGSWRVRLGSSAGASDIYSGSYQSAWSLSFDSGQLEWGGNNWWDGMVDDDYIRHPYIAPMTLPTWYSARYVRIEISDAANPDGYIQMGRIFVGSGFVPALGARYGLSEGWDDVSRLDYTLSGVLVADIGRRRRWAKFELGYIRQADEVPIVHEMLRRLGTAGEVLYLPNTSNWQDCQRYGFVGRLREMSAIEYPYVNARSIGLVIEELI
jgi:hypothetical protein